METKITQERLRELFEYKENGTFVRKISTSNRVKSGDLVGWKTVNGRYLGLSINGKKEFMHRMVFLYHYGYIPECIDHIDGDGTNNRIENLRAASRQQNMLNVKGFANTKSGIKNVHWSHSSQKWEVRCRVNKKIKHIGVFEDLELAELVAIEARNKYHGNFANHGVKTSNE